MENSEISHTDHVEEKEISEKEILSRLHLYHQTTLEKWEKVQKQDALLSEKELINRGLINKSEIDDLEFEDTNTGDIDRQAGRDGFVFASHYPAGYGEVTLELDLSILQIPGAKVATAGDWMHFCVDEDDRRYFIESEIPATEFIKYLQKFIARLPNPEWFWGTRDEELKKLLDDGFKESVSGHSQKIKTFWALHPEIMIPEQIPLKYVKNVEINKK